MVLDGCLKAVLCLDVLQALPLSGGVFTKSLLAMRIWTSLFSLARRRRDQSRPEAAPGLRKSIQAVKCSQRIRSKPTYFSLVSAPFLTRFLAVVCWPFLPSSMPRRIRLCVSHSRAMKLAVTISKNTVETVVRTLKSYSERFRDIFGSQPIPPPLRGGMGC